MALTKDDLQAIGVVVEQKIRQSEERIDANIDAKIHASEKRLVAAMDERFARENLPPLEELAGTITPLQPEKASETVIREAKENHYHKRFLKHSRP